MTDDVAGRPTFAGLRVVPSICGDGPNPVGELGGDALVALGDVAHEQVDAMDGGNSSPVGNGILPAG